MVKTDRQAFRILRVSIAAAVVACLAACSSTKPILTKSINFRCDSNFNDGFILPVDVVYIPDGEKEDTILGVSPDEWFDSDVRNDWPYVQTLSFRESEVRATTKIDLKKAENTMKIIIFADYRSLSDGKTQMVVLGPESKENENIFITINGLLH